MPLRVNSFPCPRLSVLCISVQRVRHIAAALPPELRFAFTQLLPVTPRPAEASRLTTSPCRHPARRCLRESSPCNAHPAAATLRESVRDFAIALPMRCHPWLCPCATHLCRSRSLRFVATPLLSYSPRRLAQPLLARSLLRLCFVEPCRALPLNHFTQLLHALTQPHASHPCLCFSTHFAAMPSQCVPRLSIAVWFCALP